MVVAIGGVVAGMVVVVVVVVVVDKCTAGMLVVDVIADIDIVVDVAAVVVVADIGIVAANMLDTDVDLADNVAGLADTAAVDMLDMVMESPRHVALARI